jgi:hypothetical protein
VAYFTAAENSDVDAMSSASVTVVDGVAIKLSYLIQPFFSCIKYFPRLTFSSVAVIDITSPLCVI